MQMTDKDENTDSDDGEGVDEDKRGLWKEGC